MEQRGPRVRAVRPGRQPECRRVSPASGDGRDRATRDLGRAGGEQLCALAELAHRHRPRPSTRAAARRSQTRQPRRHSSSWHDMPPASQLEHIVREYRRADPSEQPVPTRRTDSATCATEATARGWSSSRRALTPRRQRSCSPASSAPGPSFPRGRGRTAVRRRFRGDAPARRRSRGKVATGHEQLDAAIDVCIDPAEQHSADALVALCASVLAAGISEVEDPHISLLVHVDEQVPADPCTAGCAHVEGLWGDHRPCRGPSCL